MGIQRSLPQVEEEKQHPQRKRIRYILLLSHEKLH